MQIILYIIGGLIGLIVIFLIYRYWATIKASQKRDKDIFEKVKPLINSLDKKTTIDHELINKLANDPGTRGILYSILEEHNKTNLFPDKYNNFKSSAESSLVYWLLHPNELGDRPDQIEYVQKVTREQEVNNKNQKLDYYVFKFKMNPPHWAADDGWTIGIAGPYDNDNVPYDFAPGTFSSFEKFDSKSPDEHVDWLHGTLNKKGLY
ncbi:hypothetical protein KFE94_02335 [bacterium SCSIO 12643]|nr:hypothetical protein KFE94_02335 [bacterium SCSIO 12643]